MKFFFKILIIHTVCSFMLFAGEKQEGRFEMKGFYLGMEQAKVQALYEQLQKDKMAEYVSLEREKYRDMIKLDNEFSSMGNKIDIEYDDDGLAKKITFQYKTVAILFDAGDLDAGGLVQKIEEEYHLPEMEFEDMGMVKTWTYVNDKLNYKISVDDVKNVRLQRMNK